MEIVRLVSVRGGSSVISQSEGVGAGMVGKQAGQYTAEISVLSHD